MKTILNIYRIIVSIICLSFCFLNISNAQNIVNSSLSLTLYQDSVATDESTQFIRNTIGVFNKSNTKQTIEIRIDAPNGFPPISSAVYPIEVNANDSVKLPFTLSKLSNADAGKSICKIIVNKQGLIIAQKDFVIINKEINYLKVVPMKNSFTIDDNTTSIPLALKLKNLGNKSNTFSIIINDPFLAVNKSWTMTLQPLQDSIFRFEYEIPKYVLKEIDNRRIAVSVSDGEMNIPYFFYVTKIQNNNYQHKTPYDEIPLSVETGAFVFGKTVNAYWGASTQFELSNNTNVDLIYRSKTFGIGGVQYDYFLASLTHKRVTATIGQMNDVKEFLATGLGASVTYAKNDSQNITITGISDKMSSYQSSLSKEIAINANYRLLNSNFNSYAISINNLSLKLKSNIWINNVSLINNPNLQLNATLGMGNSKDSLNTNTLGYRYGYQFMIKNSSWGFRSNALINTNDLPGIYQGWRSINNYLNHTFSKLIALEAFYSQNYTRQTVASDSLYRYNELLYNQTSFGISSYITFKRSIFRIGAGREKSFGTFSNIMTPEYYTFNYGINVPISSWLKVNVTGSYNYLPSTNNQFSSTKFSTVFGGITSKYGGVNGFYMVRPLFDSTQNGPNAAYLSKSYQIAPFINFKLWREKLNCRIQYGHYGLTSKDLISSKTNVLIGFITYSDPKKGMNFSINGSYYIKSTYYIPNTVSFSFRKTLGVPIITKRKYYDMDIILYEDLNGNGKYDKEIDALATKQNILINNIYTVNNTNDKAKDSVATAQNLLASKINIKTDKNGNAQYKNASLGKYVIDFSKMENNIGLVPVNGFVQEIELKKNPAKVFIPFNKGRKVAGNIRLILDDNSVNKFDIGSLKITATDSAGLSFATYSDPQGAFTFSLPAGNYKISLNPEAFDDNFRPTSMAIDIDLLNHETQNIAFIVKQKPRKINKVKANL